MRKKTKITFLVFLSLGVLSVLFVEQLLRFRNIPGDDGKVHTTSSKAICRAWHRDFEFFYGDGSSLTPNCEEALSYPAQDVFAPSANGFQIHYKIFQDFNKANLADETPIWLHVHGITGDWLSAARYIKVASSLNLRLAGMDLSNHGESTNDGKGAFWGCRESSDVIAVVKSLREKYPKAPILVSAVSMGTMAVARAEKSLRSLGVKAILLEAPIGNVRTTLPFVLRPVAEIALGVRAFEDDLDLRVCDANAALPEFKTPTLIVNVEGDPYITKKDATIYFERLPKDLNKRIVFFEKGIHTLAYNYNKEEFIKEFENLYTSAIGKGSLPGG